MRINGDLVAYGKDIWELLGDLVLWNVVLVDGFGVCYSDASLTRIKQTSTRN